MNRCESTGLVCRFVQLTMALADSLLSAIVRADGDALVMHVGERPYVVAGTGTINISTHDLIDRPITGMMSQLLPAEALATLEEVGAVEHRLQDVDDDRFNVVAARGGDDIWIEIRRRRDLSDAAIEAAAAAPPPESARCCRRRTPSCRRGCRARRAPVAEEAAAEEGASPADEAAGRKNAALPLKPQRKKDVASLPKLPREKNAVSR